MSKKDRLMRIESLLNQSGSVRVADLSQTMGVSEVTIRSDLEQLEKNGVLIRTLGGAVLTNDQTSPAIESLFGEKLFFDPRKEQIGKKAAALVQEEEWIFIGQGSTCYNVAKALVKKNNINVLTNNLPAAVVLAQNPKSKVIVTGGSLIHEYMFLAGDILLRSLDKIFLSKAFMGVSGIDFKGGFTVSNDAELRIYDKIKNITNQLIIVGDSTKFSKPTFISIGALSMPDIMISDDGIPEEYVEYFKENQVDVV